MCHVQYKRVSNRGNVYTYIIRTCAEMIRLCMGAWELIRGSLLRLVAQGRHFEIHSISQ